MSLWLCVRSKYHSSGKKEAMLSYFVKTFRLADLSIYKFLADIDSIFWA